MRSIWRHPAEESVDLYPGLTVRDDRVTGSITAGRSRLPLWAFMGTAISHGWGEVEHGYSPSEYGWTQDKAAAFVYDLCELRGEFGRLICVLADAERTDRSSRAWWETKKHRKRVAAQLRICLAILEDNQ